jgi:hypothetical protein
MTTEYANKNWWLPSKDATEAKKLAVALMLEGKHDKTELRKRGATTGEPIGNWHVAHKGSTISLEHDQFRPINQHQKLIDSYEPGQSWEMVSENSSGYWTPCNKQTGPNWETKMLYRRVATKPKADWAFMPRWANYVFLADLTSNEWMWSVREPKWGSTHWVVTGLTGVIPHYISDDFEYGGSKADSVLSREPEDMLKEPAEKTKNDFKVTLKPAPDHNLDLCPCETCVEERADKLKIKEAVYGYCPVCGCAGKYREKRPAGNDTCDAGHTYPSKDAIKKPDVGLLKKMTKRTGKDIPPGRAGAWYPF